MKSILPVCLTYLTKKWFSVTTELDLSNPIFHEFFTIFRAFYQQLSRAYQCKSVRIDSVCDLSLWHQWLDGGSHKPSAPDTMELSGASFFNSAQPIWMVLSGSITDGSKTTILISDTLQDQPPRVLLRLIRRSNVEPKCGNNTFLVSPRSFSVTLFHLSLYRLRTVNGPCSTTYCKPAEQYQVSRGRSRYLLRQGPTMSVSKGGPA